MFFEIAILISTFFAALRVTLVQPLPFPGGIGNLVSDRSFLENPQSFGKCLAVSTAPPSSPCHLHLVEIQSKRKNQIAPGKRMIKGNCSSPSGSVTIVQKCSFCHPTLFHLLRLSGKKFSLNQINHTFCN